MTPLKIIGIGALLFWMAFITFRIEDTRHIAQQGCVYAFQAAGHTSLDMPPGCS